MKYTPLESDIAKNIGSNVTFNGSSSFEDSAILIYTLFFSAIVLAAFYRYTVAGLARMQASEAGIRKSNEIFKKTTLGLLGVFSLFLIISTVNKDLLTADIGLGSLNQRGGTYRGVVNVTESTPITRSGSGTSRACDPVDQVKASLASPSGVCASTACTVLTGCKYQQYLSTIQSVSNDLGVNYKMIVVTMCKESGGNPNAQNKNSNNTYDCGLMQINQTAPCDATILETKTNITKGVQEMKKKMVEANRVYTNIPAEAGVFASYNCCANGTIPNEPSGSCKQSDGWPSIPKWACPIDPGTSEFNMCGVKAYACELVNCLKSLP